MLKKTIVSALFLAAMTSASMAATAWTTASVNFRDGPGASYYRLGTLGACVQVTLGESQNNWYRIQWNGRWGWVSARYLTSDGGYCSRTTYTRPAPAPRSGY